MLSEQRRRFVAEYLVDKNATQAALRAGYSPKTAHAQGSFLLNNVEVSEAIAEGLQAQLDEVGITAARVMKEMATLATIDLRTFYDDKGNLKAMHELTPEQGAALAGVETLKRNVTSGDGEMDTVYKLKLWDKPRALEMLAKHFGLLIERMEHSGTVTYKWQD